MNNSASSELTVSARSLSRSYGGNPAVRDVSLELRRGEVLGLLGPNGAGKTTTMKMLDRQPCAKPRGGQHLRHRSVGPAHGGKAHIGYLPEIPPVYKELKVDEYLRLAGRLHKVRKVICHVQ